MRLQAASIVGCCADFPHRAGLSRRTSHSHQRTATRLPGFNVASLLEGDFSRQRWLSPPPKPGEFTARAPPRSLAERPSISTEQCAHRHRNWHCLCAQWHRGPCSSQVALSRPASDPSQRLIAGDSVLGHRNTGTKALNQGGNRELFGFFSVEKQHRAICGGCFHQHMRFAVPRALCGVTTMPRVVFF